LAEPHERRRCKSGKAKPDETLRQKDPAPTRLWKVRSPAIKLLENDTDGVSLVDGLVADGCVIAKLLNNITK
jgi:hypothetical protein